MIRDRIWIALIVAMASLLLASRSLSAQVISIRFFDVGQGDAALISTPEGRHVLIDAGRNRMVADSLVAWRIDTLDLVIASHGHADHIGGIDEVLARTVVLAYLDNEMPERTASYARVVEAVRKELGVYPAPPRVTDSIGSVRFRALSRPDSLRTQNERSVGILVQFGQFDALFTGDSEVRELEHWLARDSVPQVEVLKVAHHGSTNATTQPWAEATRPALAIISVGSANRYGHPSPDVVATWSAAGAAVLRTDQVGEIEIAADSTGRFRVATVLGSWPSDSLSAIAARQSR